MSHSAAARQGRNGLSVAVAGGVAWLRLERPAAGNRITLDLAQALCAAAAEIELDDRVIVVVLAGAGPSFCLGVEDGGSWEQQADWVEAIARLTRPVVAVVHGDARGEGLELALACDLRLAASHAQLAMPQLGDGRLPVHGGTQRLPRIVGRSRALDLLLTGRAIAAPEAAAMGLLSRVVPAAELDAAVDALVTDLKGKGPIALRYAKEAVLAGSELTLDQGVRLEEDLYALLQTTADRRAGVQAFQQRRRPVFRGK